jgi:hypothetical protein
MLAVQVPEQAVAGQQTCVGSARCASGFQSRVAKRLRKSLQS